MKLVERLVFLTTIAVLVGSVVTMHNDNVEFAANGNAAGSDTPAEETE